MRRDVARGITLAATGVKGQEGDPCLTIADQGEGQTPRKFPDTFLSLEKSNKLRIPFVQGKFNMGGTGVLQRQFTKDLGFRGIEQAEVLPRLHLGSSLVGSRGGDAERLV
jgi:hypothetical protein